MHNKRHPAKQRALADFVNPREGSNQMNDVNVETPHSAAPNSYGGGRKVKDITGQTFSRWTVIRRDGRNSVNQATWLCVCSCADKTVKTVAGVALRNGKSKSCGCYQRETASRTTRIHGYCGTPLYKTYVSMMYRCYCPSGGEYIHYGGRGIRVCERWMDIHKFMEDMMPTWHEGMSLDRIDVNGNYEPSNCRWADDNTQQRNRRNNRLLTALGKTQTIAAWTEETGISWTGIDARLERGWAPDEAVSIPSRSKRL